MSTRATTRLRQLVTRGEIAFLMEAHDGVSARIVAEAGFEGVWASGLTMSTSFGVRDNNELSWTQVERNEVARLDSGRRVASVLLWRRAGRSPNGSCSFQRQGESGRG